MLSWYCAQPDHDVTTAACEIREHRIKLSTVTDPDERKRLNDEHKQHGKDKKFKTTTKLYYIFKKYCQNVRRRPSPPGRRVTPPRITSPAHTHTHRQRHTHTRTRTRTDRHTDTDTDLQRPVV